MDKNNIYEILKSMPKGTKLYSPLYGECKLSSLADNPETMEAIWTESDGSEFAFDKCGRYMPKGECVLFPSKQMRDWSKFAWKKGDVLVSVDDAAQVLFDGFVDDSYKNFNGKYLFGFNTEKIQKEVILNSFDYEKTDSKEHIEFVEEKLGGKLNLETLEIEKKPEFKDGDVLVFTFNFSGKKVHCPLIFKEFTSDSQFSSYAMQNADGELTINYKAHSTNNIKLRLATDEEKRNFLSFLTSEGYHWNADKKSVDKLVVSDKFYYFEMENELSYIAKLSKVKGHKFSFDGCVSWNARHSSGGNDYDPSSFDVEDKACFGFREATEDEINIYQQEASKKTDSYKFKPLDYVLAKSIALYEDNVWNLFQYAYQNKEGVHIMVGGAAFKECIPYAGNEELLGTTKSVGNDGE